jgi:hypothetical protein
MSQFSDWLAGFGGGALDDELTAALTEVTEAVRLEGKVGAVTLKLKIGDKADGVIVEADVTATPPRAKGRSAFFYVDPRTGLLTHRHPNQPQLPGTEDSTAKKENQP